MISTSWKKNQPLLPAFFYCYLVEVKKLLVLDVPDAVTKTVHSPAQEMKQRSRGLQVVHWDPLFETKNISSGNRQWLIFFFFWWQVFPVLPVCKQVVTDGNDECLDSSSLAIDVSMEVPVYRGSLFSSCLIKLD